MDTTPFWFNAELPQFPALNQDRAADVVVIGGGVTGITAASLLRAAGAKVILLERQRCASADTGHTTAHLTYVTDLRLHRIVKKFGRDAAKAFWTAGAVAIDQIHDFIHQKNIQCDFRWVPGYLRASLAMQDPKEIDSLKADATLAQELGFRAEFVPSVPLAARAGVRFHHQAKFHPRKYLGALLSDYVQQGGEIFENSEATEVADNPLSVQVGAHRVECNNVFVATHTPISGKTNLFSATIFQTKLALYTSYALGARLPAGTIPEALFWDTSDPYYYLRIEPGDPFDYAIFGGEDCKTGQEDEVPAVFQRLEEKLHEVLPAAEVRNRWLGQVVETNDGLPFIGETAEHQFVATGFSGNGFTLGTLGAMMARDRFLGKQNPWFDLFDVHRKKLLGGTWRYITENVDFPYYLLRDRLAKAETDTTDDIKFGEGKIVRQDGKKMAAYRDDSGKLTLLSPVCTHLGCIVRWNGADRTWDCPCHGSRFKPTGEVFSGPAETPLERAQ